MQITVNSATWAGIVPAGALMFLTIGHWRLAWLTIAAVALVATAATRGADESTARHQVSDPSPPRTPARTSGLGC